VRTRTTAVLLGPMHCEREPRRNWWRRWRARVQSTVRVQVRPRPPRWPQQALAADTDKADASDDATSWKRVVELVHPSQPGSVQP